jgi:hypothetical protein
MSGITVPLALAAGVVSFASPCFLPIVPVYVGYLAGSGAGTPPVASGPAAGSASLVPGSGAASTRVLTRARRATVTQACAFVAGFSVVFVALWASIGLVGYAAGDYRDPLRVLGGAVLVVMGAPRRRTDRHPGPVPNDAARPGPGARSGKHPPLDAARGRLRRRLVALHRPHPGRGSSVWRR